MAEELSTFDVGTMRLSRADHRSDGLLEIRAACLSAWHFVLTTASLG